MTSSPDTISLVRRLALAARDIKLSHSLFALPFAALAMFLAAGNDRRLPYWGEIGLIVSCMVAARTMAMAVNRWADARLDAANPRTAGRAIPSGRLSPAFMLAVAIVCACVFVVMAAGFGLFFANFRPLALSPAALFWLAAYSWSKRFTWLCHLWLGVALGLSPAAATVAINPAFLARPEPYLLAAMVACWVAGFDIIYAMQDVRVDRSAGLYSMPASLGIERALWISRLLHAAAAFLLSAMAMLNPQLSWRFIAGIVIVSALLILEHALVWRSRTHHINLAFFTINGIISLLLGAAGVIDVMASLR